MSNFDSNSANSIVSTAFRNMASDTGAACTTGNIGDMPFNAGNDDFDDGIADFMTDSYWSDSYWSDCDWEACYCSYDDDDDDPEAKEMGLKNHLSTGHTYRLKSAAFHRQLSAFRIQPLLYKYIRSGGRNAPRLSQSSVDEANSFCDKTVEDGCLVRSLDNDVPFSLNKRKRWLLLDRLTLIIDEVDVDESEFEVSHGIRQQQASKSDRLCARDLCTWYESTIGREQRYTKRNCRLYANTETLIENLEPKLKHSKHDWKPVFQKMTHNQHFRGVQRQQMLKQGYRRTLRKILKTEAEERVTNEWIAIEMPKPEVVYDVIEPTEHCEYQPKIVRIAPKKIQARRKTYVNRASRLSPTLASKFRGNIQTDLDEFIADEAEPRFLCCPCGCRSGPPDSEPENDIVEVTLADFVTTSPKRNRREKRRYQRDATEPSFKYKPPKVEAPVEETSRDPFEYVQPSENRDGKKRNPSENQYDSGFEISPGNSQSDEPYIYPELPTSQTVFIQNELLQPETLARKYGVRYSEGKSQPRRFSITLPDAASPAYVLFQVHAQYDVGMAEVAVRLHSETETENVLNLCPEFDNLLTVNDVVQASSHYVLATSEQPKRRDLFGSCKVDMKRLNRALGNQVEIFTKEEAFNVQRGVNEVEQQPVCSDGRTPTTAMATAFLTDFVYCGICYGECRGDEYSNRWSRLNRCQHVYCNECWSRHLISCVRRRETQLLCPAHDCDSAVDTPTVLSLVDNATYRLYEKLTRELQIEKSPEWQWCPSSKCSRIAYKRTANVKSGLSISCACGHAWCFSCQNNAHWPATCEQAERYAEDLKEVGAAVASYSVPVSSVEVKKCPVCSYPIEKFQGCNLMYCSLCKSSFCWNCLTPSSRLIHSCRESHKETVYLVDVIPAALRWLEEAVRRRTRWQSQQLYVVSMIKLQKGVRNKKYDGGSRRRVCATAIGQEALSAARLYNHVIEHMMVIWMNCRRRKDMMATVKLAYHSLLYVTERLESIIITSSIIGKISTEDRNRIPHLIKLGDRNLVTLSRQIRGQQSVIIKPCKSSQ